MAPAGGCSETALRSQTSAQSWDPGCSRSTTPAFQPAMPTLQETHDDDAEASVHDNDGAESSVSIQGPNSAQMSGISGRSPSNHQPVPSGSIGDEAIFNIRFLEA